MKNFFCLCSVAMLLLSFVSCDSGNDANFHGTGKLSLGLSATSSFTSQSRSVDESVYMNPDNYTVEVADETGIQAYNGSYKDMPMEIELEAEKTYTVKAFCGENVDAGFDCLYVEGKQQFILQDGELKNIVLACRPANVKVSLAYTEDFLKYYTDCTVHLQTSHLTTPFDMHMKSDAGKDAFLKANPEGELLTITIDGFVDKEGNPVVLGEVLTATKTIAPKNHLIITLDPEVIVVSGGSASFDVDVDEGTENKDINIEIPEEYWPGNVGK